MNKIHSKIWNRELGQLVVASELASCPRASATSGQAVRLQRPRAFLFGALAAAGGMAWSLAAQAQSVSCLPPPYNAYAGTSACIGYGAQAAGDGATALGASAASNGGGTVAVGYLSKATNLNAIAMGFNSRADAVNAINIGPTTGTATGARAESAIAIGTDVTVTSDSAGGIAIGSQARVTLGTAVALGAQAVASGQGATSIGLGTQSLGAHATAVGFQAYATALNALYLGPRTAGAGASAESAIGIGTDVSASGTYAVGIGLRANASQNNALSIGVDSASNATNGIAIGSLANSGAASTAGAFVDNWTPQSTQRRAGFVAGNMAVGASSIANNNGAAIGASAEATGAESFAGGAAAVASGRVGIAVGGASLASGDSAVAIGNTSTAGGDHSAALGAGAEAKAVGSLAVGFTAMANNTGDVALGSGSTTDMAVGTPGTTINGTAYTFQGITPTSTVSVGAAGVERTITNVAAGRISGSSTDAINGSQLFATNQAVDGLGTTVTNLGDSIATTIGGGTTYDPSTGTINTSVTYGGNTYNSLQQVFNQIDSSVDAATTRYYSVNDNGTQGGNYANDGASGVNALAAGVGATAVADNATALGQDTGVSVLGGVALGSGAVSDRAIAPTSGTITVGTNTVPYNTTDRNLLGAVSVGNATDFRQVTNVADGTEDQDAVTLRQLKGAMSSFSVTPIKYFHANSIAADSAAIGAESIAVGPQTTVNGDNGIGIGNHAIVQQTAPGGTAIGQDTTVNLADGVALGTNATSNAIQSMALGAGSQAAFVGSVALGAGSVTADKVATTGTTINGVAYTFAGGAPGSTVSVGDVGAERTITNVGAGRISNSSTDAINGSQLFAVQDAIGTVGNSVTNLGNTVTNLGDSIANSIGGSTTYDPTTGTINTSINYAGNTYNSVQQVFDQIGTNGIKYFHANSNLADSIAAGVNSVAIGPVSNASTDNAVSIGNGATAGSNVGDVALGAGSTTDTVVQTGGGTIAGTTYTYAGGTPTSTVSVGAPGAERTITNVAAGQVNGGSTDAVNGSQLFATNQALDSLNTTVINNATHYYSVNDNGTQGGNYANDGASGVNALAAGVGATAVADNATALGQDTGVSVLGGVALGSGAVSDRAIAPTSGTITVGTNTVPYNTTDRNLLGAVSVGNATDFRQVTNVADGTEDQDAVTLRQLKGAMSSFSVTPTKYFHANSAAADSAAVGAESVAVGPETTVNGDNGIGMGNHAIVQQTAPGGIAVGQDTTVNLADGVALGTGATANAIQGMALGAGSEADYVGSVALGSGSKTDAAVGTANATLAGTTYNFAGVNPGSTVSVGAAGAERTITNLAAGRISQLSTDAINGSQLFATNASIDAIYSELTNLSNTVNNLPPGGGGTTINNTYQTSPDNTTSASAGGNNSTAAGAGSTATGDNSTAIGAGSNASGDNSVAIGAGSVANTTNTVSVGSVGHERTVTNVAAGVNPTDAVNVGQLDQAIESAKNWSKDYVDQRFQSVDRDLNRIGNRANAGVASAMAMASLPQAYQPNQNSAAVAVGSFHGETGVAVGLSTITESGHYVLKLNATTNSRGDAGAGVGAAVVW